jgi:ABC-type oligopeptide transport system ATPase subunit
MNDIICQDCEGLLGRNRDCSTCVASGRKVALASEFSSGTGKTTFGLQIMKAWKDSGGEVVFINLEMTPPTIEVM